MNQDNIESVSQDASVSDVQYTQNVIPVSDVQYTQNTKNEYNFLPNTPESLLMLLMSITLTLLFIAAAYFGSKQSWYINLPVKSQDNVWILAGAWIFVSLISYGAFYLIRNADEQTTGKSRLLPLFLIVSYINLLWAIVFYLYQSFIGTEILIGLIILINLYIIIFLWSISIWAALTIVPLEILYIYLLYSIIHLGTVNNISF